MREAIQVGYQAYVSDGPEAFGAIHEASPRAREVTVYVENAGDFRVPIEAVTSVAFGKVTFDRDKLDPLLRQAIVRARDAESE